MVITNWKKPKEERKCRGCGEKLPAQPLKVSESNTLQTYLTISTRMCKKCQMERARLKKEQKKERELQRKAKARLRKAQSSKGRKSLKKKAEELLHRYLRLRAKDFQGNCVCYTCGRLVPYELTNASHFWHGKLDLDERNLKVCCIGCNKYKHGELGKYAIHLIEDYGKEWVDRLRIDAENEEMNNYTYEFLLATIEKYTNLLKTL